MSLFSASRESIFLYKSINGDDDDDYKNNNSNNNNNNEDDDDTFHIRFDLSF